MGLIAGEGYLPRRKGNKREGELIREGKLVREGELVRGWGLKT